MSSTSLPQSTLLFEDTAQDIDPQTIVRYVLLVPLLIVTIGSSILVPILVSLFFFSTSDLRRKPIFIINVLSILSGIGMGVANIYIAVRALFGKQVDIEAVGVTSVCLGFFSLYIADAVLLIRVYAVYPPARLTRLQSFVVYTPITLLKIARLVNIILYMASISQSIRTTQSALSTRAVTWMSPAPKIEWFLAAVDTTFSSVLFLIRLHPSRRTREDLIVCSRSSHTTSSNSYLLRLRTLFWIAISNFIFPVFLNLVQIIISFIKPNGSIMEYFCLSNVYISIVSALLATLWCSSTRWASAEHDVHNPQGEPTIILQGPVFALASNSSVSSRDEETQKNMGMDFTSSQ